ncbi:MAG: diphthine--ammonia ligase [Pyrobaculum sp.]
MRVAVLYTGGKDSHYAMLKALAAGHTLSCLVTAVPKNPESYMFHTVNIKWSLLHGEAMGVRQYAVEVSGEKEREVEELAQQLARIREECPFDGLVTGAVASRYQKERVDAVAARLGVAHLAPNWGRDQEELLREEARAMRFIITAAMAMGLGPQHLGKVVTPAAAEEIIALSRKYGFSPVGEGGEYETYVVESPLFSIEVEGEAHWHPSGWGYYEIRAARIKFKKFPLK